MSPKDISIGRKAGIADNAYEKLLVCYAGFIFLLGKK